MSNIVDPPFTRAEAIAIREALDNIVSAIDAGVFGAEANWPVTSVDDAQAALRRVTAAIDYRWPSEIRDEWDAGHPDGTEVRYWRRKRAGEPDGVGITRGPAYEVICPTGNGREVVARNAVWIESKTDHFEGPIAITHVERRAP